jgi:predicted ester cyclase
MFKQTLGAALIAASTIAGVAAQSPEAIPGGITPEKYYDGGSATTKEAQEHLHKFDELDFEIFTNQEWSRVHESHDEDVIVTWPNGQSTVGLDVHIDDLKRLFVHAPDTKIRVHPVKIASENWTAVIGVMEGTFTEPMPIGDGKFIEPTGKSFELQMATIAFWQDGRMVHEWLFWDNETYARQLGLIE